MDDLSLQYEPADAPGIDDAKAGWRTVGTVAACLASACSLGLAWLSGAWYFAAAAVVFFLIAAATVRPLIASMSSRGRKRSFVAAALGAGTVLVSALLIAGFLVVWLAFPID
jgi:hypothetical protein